MLINSSYFIGERNIPNTSQTEVQERLTWFINKYEPQFLLTLFGYEMYKAYEAVSTQSPLPSPWLELFGGTEYTLNGKTVKWWGLVDATSKRSPIANYIYYHFMRDAETTTTGVGEVKTNPENAVLVSAARKAVLAWNEISDSVCGMISYLNENKSLYAGWEHQNVWSLRRTFRNINAFDL